jgi:cytidine deaminase
VSHSQKRSFLPASLVATDVSVSPQAPRIACLTILIYILTDFTEERRFSAGIFPHFVNILRDDYRKLVLSAIEAKKRAYAPYSRFRVGAALLTTGGAIYTGCNVEISTYALTICAERNAIFKAISEGEHRFRAIAVISDDPGFTPPCGACRQVLMDLAGNIDFLMINCKGRVKVLKMHDLLPHAFGKRNLERTRKRTR